MSQGFTNNGINVTPQQIQQSAFNVGIDSGAADAYVVTLSPPVSALTDGLLVQFVPLNNNLTGSPTLDVGTGPQTIQIFGNSSLSTSDLTNTTTAFLQWNAPNSAWVLFNPVTSLATKLNVLTGAAGGDFGSANAYVVYVQPNDITLGDISAGLFAGTYMSANNTGPSTMSLNGGSPVAITLPDGSALVGGEILAGLSYLFFFNNTNVILLNPSVITSFTTAPAASQSSSLSIGSAFQNTLGYDVVLTVYLDIASATTASISLGVGPTSTPAQQTIVSSLTASALSVIPVTIYLPNNYYALLTTSGTISVSISGQQAMPV